MRSARRVAATVAALVMAVSAGAAVPVRADTQEYSFNLDGSQVVPGPGSSGSAYGGLIIGQFGAGDPNPSDFLEWQFAVSGIGTVTSMGIHQGAAGQTGPLVVSIPVVYNPVGELNGYATGLASASTFQAIEANLAGYYLELDTAAFPGGALRGQLDGSTQPPPDTGISLAVPVLSQFDLGSGRHAEVGCGPTAAAMVLQFYSGGSTPTLSAVYDSEPMGFDKKRATGWSIAPPEQMLNVFPAFGHPKGTAVRWASANWVENVRLQLAADQPVIVLVASPAGLPGYASTPAKEKVLGHYLVVTGIDEAAGTISYNDPAKGAKTVTIALFDRVWGFAPWGPVTYGYQGVTSRR